MVFKLKLTKCDLCRDTVRTVSDNRNKKKYLEKTNT